MKVLVTGGAGYIGSQTCKALHADGFEPVVLDNISTGHRWAVKWGPFEEGDLRDEKALERVFVTHNIKAVIHFAGNAYVGESMSDPRKYFANNVANSLHLIDAVLRHGRVPIIFSSTCATYGIPESLPIAESHPQRPVSPYGESKLFVERALHWYGHAYAMSWMALRYFNAAGADVDCQVGEVHAPETHLIPLAIEATIDERSILSVFGQNFETPDGTAVRDYVHVSDIADAHVKALRYLQTGGTSRALNLGTGRGHSVKQVIERLEEITARRVQAQYSSRRPGDPAMLVADASAASAALGWQPRYSDLDTILRTALKWRDTMRRSRES